MKEILLASGESVFVDDCDFERVSEFHWHALKTKSGHTYAVTSIKRKNLLMHRFITNAPVGLVVDHIDRNGLNNLRSNLRVCTQSVNMRNRLDSKYCESVYRVYCSKGEKWAAKIRSDGKLKHVGTFSSKDEAASAAQVAKTAIQEDKPIQITLYIMKSDLDEVMSLLSNKRQKRLPKKPRLINYQQGLCK